MYGKLKFGIGIALLTLSTLAWSALGPSESVKVTVDDVLSILRNTELNTPEKREKVKDAVRPRFDYRAMSQLVLGKHWRVASIEEKDDFVMMFRDLLERTYFTALDKYSGQTVKMGREQVKGDRALVQTFVVTKDLELPVDYKVRLKGEDWLAYDVAVDGISLVSNYRTSFDNIVRQNGIQGLLKELKAKIDSAEQGQTSQ